MRPFTSQRKGSALLWVAGILLLCFLGFLGYQWYVQQGDHHEQNDQLVQDAKDAKLKVVETRLGEPGSWPQWRGRNRDAIYDGDPILTDWPATGLKQLWKVDVGAGYSSMAIAHDKVFSMAEKEGKDAVICWDAKNGKELWHYAYGNHYTDGEGDGPRCTPTVEAERVYAVGARGELMCLAVGDGSIIWQKDMAKEYNAPIPKWGVSYSPLIQGELLLTQPGAPNGASVIAFDKLTGEFKWKALDAPASYSSPILTNAANVPQALFFTGNSLASLNPVTGEQFWNFEWDTKYSCNIATPIVRGDYIFISSGYGKGCATLKVTNEAGKVDAKKVYYNWRMKNHFSTCVYHDEHIYGFDEAYFTCLELVNGKVNPDKAGEKRWRARGVRKGAPILADDHLIVLGERGELWLIEPTPDEFRPKSHFKVSDNKCWILPALANGKLYIRDEKHLMCYDISKK